MRLIAKNIDAYPLNRMKNNQTQSKTDVIHYGNWIRNKFFHYLRIERKNRKNKSKKYKTRLKSTFRNLEKYTLFVYLFNIRPSYLYRIDNRCLKSKLICLKLLRIVFYNIEKSIIFMPQKL